MSRKQQKQKGKVDLKAFLSGHVPDGHLPKGPREMSQEEKYDADQRRMERYGGAEGGGGGGFSADRGGDLRSGGNGFSDQPSAADTDETWGRAPRAVPAGGGGGMGGGMGGGEGGGEDAGRADEDDNWRGGLKAPAAGGDAPRALGGDDDSDWRGGARPAGTTGPVADAGPRPDTDDNWRGSAGRPGPEGSLADGTAAAPVKSSNDDGDWRKTASETVQEAAPERPAVKQSDNDGDWRKTASETEPVVAEPRVVSAVAAAEADDDWRKTAKDTQLDDNKSVNSGSVSGTPTANDDGDWRKTRGELSGPTQEEVIAAKKEVAERETELNSDWRGKATPAPASAPAPAAAPAETSGDWRSGRAATAPATGGGNRNFGAGAGKTNDGGNWRRGSAPKKEESSPVVSTETPAAADTTTTTAPVKTETKPVAVKTEAPVASTPAVVATPAVSAKKEEDASTPSSVASSASGRAPRGADKWDSMFSRGSPSAASTGSGPETNSRFASLAPSRNHSRFGDNSRDSEREKAFSRFSGPASRTGGGGMQRDNATTFKAFGAGRRDQRAEQEQAERELQAQREQKEQKEQERVAKEEKARENRERSFAAFGGGPRRPGGDVQQPQQQQQQQQQQPREMPQAFRQMQGGNNAPRENEQDRQANRERAFAAFGGPAGRREEGGGQGGQREGGRGGMEGAFGGQRGGGGGGMEASFGSGARPSRSMLPKLGGNSRTSNWGDDDDDDDDIMMKGGNKEKNNMTAEEKEEKVATNAKKIIDDFLLSEDKTALIAAVKTLNSPAYMSTFVCVAAAKALEAKASTKLVKVVAQMVSLLSKEKLATEKQMKEGLESLCALVEEKKSPYEATDASEDGPLARLLKLGGALKDRKVLNAVDTNDITNALLFGVVAKGATSEGVSSDSVAKLVSSGLKGKELVAAGGFEGVSGAALLTEILKNEVLLKDVQVVWAEAKEYGSLLAKLLYKESPSKAEKTLGVDALYAVQKCLSDINFPKVDDGKGKKVSLIEKIFTKFYQVEVVGEEVILAWKDDVSDEVPGKMTAIVQTSAFCNWLEAEDEESEEEDDE